MLSISLTVRKAYSGRQLPGAVLMAGSRSSFASRLKRQSIGAVTKCFEIETEIINYAVERKTRFMIGHGTN